MKRMMAGVGIAAALVLGVACSDDGDSSGSGGDGGSGGSDAASSTSGPGPGASSSSGSGGAPNCLTCAEYVQDPSAAVEAVCGFEGPGPCTPGSSCEKLFAMSLCACGDGNNPGMCNAQCPVTCDEGAGDDSGCQNCVSLECASETTQCLTDQG